jgi:hypothetical protein
MLKNWHTFNQNKFLFGFYENPITIVLQDNRRRLELSILISSHCHRFGVTGIVAESELNFLLYTYFSVLQKFRCPTSLRLIL